MNPGDYPQQRDQQRDPLALLLDLLTEAAGALQATTTDLADRAARDTLAPPARNRLSKVVFKRLDQVHRIQDEVRKALESGSKDARGRKNRTRSEPDPPEPVNPAPTPVTSTIPSPASAMVPPLRLNARPRPTESVSEPTPVPPVRPTALVPPQRPNVRPRAAELTDVQSSSVKP